MFRLKDYKCTENRRYYSGHEWTYGLDLHRFLDFNKVFQSHDSYEAFVQEIRGRKWRHWASLPCNQPLSNSQWLYNGKTGSTLDQIGVEIVRSIRSGEKKRVIFTPSKGRSAISPWYYTYPEEVTESAWRVVRVPKEEHHHYLARWGKTCPSNTMFLSYTGECTECVGFARFVILHIARAWGLQECWMIDDCVSVNGIKRTNWERGTAQRSDESISFLEAMLLVEYERRLAGDRRPSIIGVPTQRSLNKLQLPKNGFCTRRLPLESLEMIWRWWWWPDVRQVNRRAATNFVFFDLTLLDASVTYDPRLPFKEDLIFSARVILAGGNVMIYRNLHCSDVQLKEGGIGELLPYNPAPPFPHPPIPWCSIRPPHMYMYMHPPPSCIPPVPTGMYMPPPRHMYQHQYMPAVRPWPPYPAVQPWPPYPAVQPWPPYQHMQAMYPPHLFRHMPHGQSPRPSLPLMPAPAPRGSAEGCVQPVRFKQDSTGSYPGPVESGGNQVPAHARNHADQCDVQLPRGSSNKTQGLFEIPW